MLEKIQKKYIYWILVFLATFIPLYPKFPLLNINGTYVAIRLEDILILLTSVVWFFCFYNKIRELAKQTIFQAIILFWLIGFLSFLSGLLITHSVQPGIGILHWLRRIEYMLLFVMGSTALASFKQVKTLYRSILITVVLVSLYGLGQLWLNFPVVSTGNKEFSKGIITFLANNARVNSTFAGPYDLAFYLSMSLSIVASLFFYYRKLTKRFGLVVAGILIFAVLGLTASRITFFTTLIALSLVFWLHKKRIFVVGLILMACLIIVLVPDLRHRLVATFTVNILGGGGEKYTPPADKVTIYTDFSKYPKDQQAALKQKAEYEATASSLSAKYRDIAPGEPLNSTELGVSRSLGIRTNVEWPRALNAFYKNPLLGTGYSSITLATDNDLLRSLGEVGILGTGALFLVFYILIKKMFSFFSGSRNFKKCWLVGIFCATVSLLISGLFIDVLEASKISEVFWLYMGISWGLMTNPNLEENA